MIIAWSFHYGFGPGCRISACGLCKIYIIYLLELRNTQEIIEMIMYIFINIFIELVYSKT